MAARNADLRKVSRDIIIAYDNDPAGRKAQERALKKLKGFMPVYGVTLPEGRDVDECSDKELIQLFGQPVRK